MRKDKPRLPDNDLVLVVKNPQIAGALGELLSVIGQEGGMVGDIETQFIGTDHTFRELTVSVYNAEHLDHILQTVRVKTNAQILEIKDLVFDRHEGGKIHSTRRQSIGQLRDLRYIYTPGVARVCRKIHKEPELAARYTSIGNSVGVFTNGTRVLGLGNIGPVASMPVMEGKAVLYDQFVGISATPVLIDTEDPDEFIETVVRVAPSFGGIHLEDIQIPDCFHIEDELIRLLDKPVMHDDQHGTATVLLAAVLSALRHTGREGDNSIKCAQIGLGAAGLAIAKILIDYGYNVTGVDLLPESRQRLLDYGGQTADLNEAVAGADVVIATTGVVGLIKPEMVQPNQIILALSNPVPEIFPEEALAAGAAFAADGKSVNNALAFPGLFKAALLGKQPAITSAMKIAAAEAISNLAANNELVPSVFHPDVHDQVIQAVMSTFEEA